MTKITLTDLANLQNETTAVNAINDNNAVLETAFDNTLSRDGTSPNTMGANLDMNGFRILNAPSPASPTELVRFGDLTTSQTLNQGTMALQNANAVSITGGTIGTAVTGATQTPGDNSTKLATTAFVTASRTNIGSKSGTITLRGGNLPAQELTVPRYDAAETLTSVEQAQLAANAGSITISSAQALTLGQQQQGRANLGGPTAEMYTQVETSAVSSPLITRLNNTLYASEFGAVGDDATNDYTALQAFLNAVASSGKEGRLDPGKKYFISGNDLLLGQGLGVSNTALFGHGAQIRTNPAQARFGLIIQRTPPVTRSDETRKIIVEGLKISQYQDANAQGGIKVVGSTFVTLRDCSVLCGSDNATTPYANYAAFYFTLSNLIDPNTGSFWCTMDNCEVKGATTPTPVGLRIDGQCNAFKCLNSTFSNCLNGVYLVRPSTGTNANEAGLANGVRIDGCDFEGDATGNGIGFLGTAGWSTCPGLTVVNCRCETMLNFFNYSGTNGITTNPATNPPVLGFNYSTATNFINNGSALTIKQVSLV